jgi:hypothetical protein
VTAKETAMMQREELTQLSNELSCRGWYQTGQRLVAPNATLWLPLYAMQWLNLDGLQREAEQRLRRRKRGRKAYENAYDAFCATDDAESLLEALGAVLATRWPELANAS